MEWVSARSWASVELVVDIAVATLALGVGAVALTVPLVPSARLAVLAGAENVLLFLVRHLVASACAALALLLRGRRRVEYKGTRVGVD